MRVSPNWRTDAQIRFTRLDHALYTELQELTTPQRESLAQKCVQCGYHGTNYNRIVDALQTLYIEYDVSALHGHGPQSSVAVALVEQWVDQILCPERLPS